MMAAPTSGSHKSSISVEDARNVCMGDSYCVFNDLDIYVSQWAFYTVPQSMSSPKVKCFDSHCSSEAVITPWKMDR
jgi:hypothetical protein